MKVDLGLPNRRPGGAKGNAGLSRKGWAGQLDASPDGTACKGGGDNELEVSVHGISSCQ